MYLTWMKNVRWMIILAIFCSSGCSLMSLWHIIFHQDWYWKQTQTSCTAQNQRGAPLSSGAVAHYLALAYLADNVETHSCFILHLIFTVVSLSLCLCRTDIFYLIRWILMFVKFDYTVKAMPACILESIKAILSFPACCTALVKMRHQQLWLPSKSHLLPLHDLYPLLTHAVRRSSWRQRSSVSETAQWSQIQSHSQVKTVIK